MPRRVSSAQIRRIGGLVHGRLGWDREQYHAWLRELGGPASTKQLSMAEAANVIDILQDLADGQPLRVWRIDGATVLQRQRIEQAAAEAGLTDLAGVIHRATYGRCGSLNECSIYQAGTVLEAVKAIAARARRAAPPAPAR